MNMKCVEFNDNQVSTLSDLGTTLQQALEWKSWRVEGDNIVFEANDSASGMIKTGYVSASGLAYYMEDDAALRFSGEKHWGEYDIEWDDYFDWYNYVWGRNEEGDVVMVHESRSAAVVRRGETPRKGGLKTF